MIMACEALVSGVGGVSVTNGGLRVTAEDLVE